VQLRREQRAGDAAPTKSAQAVVPFVEAIVGAKAERAGLRVGLPGGACAEVRSSSEVELIAELLCALAKRRIAEEAAC
jgi:hypothetical protein